MSRGRVVNVRVTDAGLAAFDEVCKTRGVRRSEGWREAMSHWMQRPPAGMGVAAGANQTAPSLGVAHTLSEKEWKQYLWMNDFAEKCYLHGLQLQPGFALEGLRFTIELAEDPDLGIP